MANPGPNITSTSNLEQSLVSSDGRMIGSSSSALIGFYGVGPVAQAAPATNVHTVAAGSVTSVFVNTTFDGSVGSTAYTVGDIVAILKGMGILKS